eukprot:257787-Hanusia_phi.AAC.1
MRGMKALNCGDRKFCSSQNLTWDLVFLTTDSIMILRKHSYRCPDASEKRGSCPPRSSPPPPAPPSSRPRRTSCSATTRQT